MKRKWIIPVTAVLLLLLIPIPTGTYKDGGTKTYAALTYKIVDWNHMYDDSVYNNTKVYPFPMNFMSLNSLWDRDLCRISPCRIRRNKAYGISELVQIYATYILYRRHPLIPCADNEDLRISWDGDRIFSICGYVPLSSCR